MTPQEREVACARAEVAFRDWAGVQRRLERAERAAVERERCECGASGCPRSAERWWAAAAELQAIAREAPP